MQLCVVVRERVDYCTVPVQYSTMGESACSSCAGHQLQNEVLGFYIQTTGFGLGPGGMSFVEVCSGKNALRKMCVVTAIVRWGSFGVSFSAMAAPDAGDGNTGAMPEKVEEKEPGSADPSVRIVFLLMPDAFEHTMQFSPALSIAQVKAEVAADLQLAVDTLTLDYNGAHLDENDTLGKLGFGAGSTQKLTLTVGGAGGAERPETNEGPQLAKDEIEVVVHFGEYSVPRGSLHPNTNLLSPPPPSSPPPLLSIDLLSLPI